MNLTLRYLLWSSICLWMYACTYTTAKRPGKNWKHQINIHQGSKHKSIIRWLSKPNGNNSVILRKWVQRRHRSLREQESQEIGKGFSAENPAAKSSPKTRNTHWLMRSKNILGAGEPKRSMQCWRVRGRDAWMSRRHFHCNCLNCCGLLFQGQTLGAWQSQFCSRHRSSTQAHSLDSIKGTLGDHGKN